MRAINTTCFELIPKIIITLLLSFIYPITLTTNAEAAYSTGSMSFSSSGQYVSVPNNNDFAVGTGNFTVEWWQNMNAAPTAGQIYNWPRVWWIASSLGSFGLSVEPNGDNPQVYFWLNGATLVGNLSNFSTNYQNIWTHFAITRTESIVRIFINGTQLGSNITNTFNFSDGSTNLTIGNHPGDALRCVFPGLISNFHFINGTSLYSTNFTRPITPTKAVANTKLLLLNKSSVNLLTDSSLIAKSLTNAPSPALNVSYSSAAPNWSVDSVVPTLSSTSLTNDGSSISLTFSEDLSENLPTRSSFTVNLNGSETKTINSLTGSGNSLTLNLSSPISANTNITISYTDPSGGDDANAIQDEYGNDLASITNQSVLNSMNSPYDSALQLNGSNQYINKAGLQIIPASTTSGDFFTVEAWIFPTAAVANSVIVSQGTSSNRFYVKRTSDGVIRFYRQGQASESVCGVAPQDQWTHVAVVVGTSQSKCFLDGSLFNTYSVASTTAVGAGFTIGSYTPILNDPQYLFAGRIDEVRIWSTDRSASIVNDMKSYGGALSNGLLAYYDFNELSGSTLINRSTGGSNSFNLTTTNSPQLVSIETTSSVQAYTVTTFPRSYLVASGGWKTPANRQLRVFAVGGGGGGGFNSGGGGSGGGYLETIYSANQETVSIVVGVGGIGAGPSSPRTTATNGTASLFGSSSAGGGNYGINYVSGSAGGAAVNGYGKGGNGTQSVSVAGSAGNAGISSNITGTALNYGGGGGGGGWATSTNGGAGGAGGGGAGAGANLSAPVNGTANFGGGGGASRDSSQIAANGGSGVVIIAYINETPTILAQPSSDTTTAGIVETFTITTSAVPTPLTKSIQWQFTADTTTGTTGWTNVSTGTGGTTDTFTTATLTKSMNKYRYRAIVTFSDTSTLSVVETSTAAILTINDSITITSDTSTITRKYGTAQTPPRTITYSGGTTESGTVGTSTSHTVRGAYGTLASGKIVLDTATSTVVFRVDTGTAVGTYIETITVTDFKGATATYTQRVVVTPADTLTVQADTLTAITYNPAGMTINPTVTITGLVASDTSSAVTFTFSETCAAGGSCSLGDTGPGGGTVFYVSGSTYYEAAPKNWYSTVNYNGSTYTNSYIKFCSDNSYNTKNQNFSFTASTGWGGGKANTAAFVNSANSGCTTGAVHLSNQYRGGGKDDWYVPNATELNGLANYWVGISSINTQFTETVTAFYWTSDATSWNASWGWLFTQPYFNSSSVWTQAGAAYNHQGGYIIPIRYFTASGGTQNLVGNPTNAGTYTITPSALTLANGVDTNNYVNVVYRTSQFTINKAVQSLLNVASKLGDFKGNPSAMKLGTSGGSDTGTVTFSIASGGTASGCTISGESLTVTSAGTCKVVATKAATRNYLIAYSDTATITFSLFVTHQPVQTQSVPSQLPINGANALDTATVTVSTLLISSVTRTGAGTHTVTGTGFSDIEVIRIGGDNLIVSNYSVSGGGNSITLSGVAAFSGPLFIRKTDGQEAVYFQIDWS